MPSNDYTHANTAPTAVTPASFAGTATEPDGVDTPDFAGAAGAPTAVALASMAGTAAAPTGVAGADFDHAADEPDSITGADHTPTGGAPGAVTPASFAGTGDAPAGVALAGLTPTGNAPTARAGGIGGAGTASSPQQVAASTALQPITDANMHTATLTFLGKLKTEQPFGLYVPPAAGLVVGVQLSAQVVPTGDDVIIELVDADGISLGRTATLPAGESYAAVTFGTALPFLAGAIIRAVVTQVGSGTAGSYLTANLLVQLN